MNIVLRVMGMGMLVGQLWAATAAEPRPAGSGATAPVTVAKPAEELYHLQPGDKLLYRVRQDPVKSSESQALIVNALGELHFPIGNGSVTVVTVVARGKSLEEVAAQVKERLEADYYHTADVELRLQERSMKAGQVLLYGRGVRGGPITLAPGEKKTILEAVIQAGVSDYANLRKVKLHRSDPATQKPVTRVVDVEEIKKTGDRAKDVLLMDGDRIEVPEKGIVF